MTDIKTLGTNDLSRQHARAILFAVPRLACHVGRFLALQLMVRYSLPRQCITDLRRELPMRIELLESRCLLSGTNSTLAPLAIVADEATDDASVRFAVIGDYGSDGLNEAAVADLVKSWSPDFVITVGDNNYPVGSAATIDANIGKYYHEFIGNYQGSYGAGAATNRFFPSLGNHDWETNAAQPYRDYFTLPGNERYYEFVWGPVHLFALDSDPREPDGRSSTSTQAQWLQAALASSTSEFQVVYFHHPPYSSGGVHAGDTTMRWPFKEWGADAVLAGHDHVYERLQVNGLPYFVNGLGGRSIYSFGATAPGSQVRFNDDYGAMLVTADSDSMTFEFYSVANGGTRIDQHTITLDVPVVPSVSINDVTIVEGNTGTRLATFNVGLSGPSTRTVTVMYATNNGTASAGSDYLARSGTLTFNPGTISQTLSVPVQGDTIDELDETFFVNLTNATNATLADQQGVGLIQDDDLTWRNAALPEDVNADTLITAQDALIVINAINSRGIGPLEPPSPPAVPPPFVDVNGDWYLSPSDALRIINVLNASTAAVVESPSQDLSMAFGTSLARSHASGQEASFSAVANDLSSLDPKTAEYDDTGERGLRNRQSIPQPELAKTLASIGGVQWTDHLFDAIEFRLADAFEEFEESVELLAAERFESMPQLH